MHIGNNVGQHFPEYDQLIVFPSISMDKLAELRVSVSLASVAVSVSLLYCLGNIIHFGKVIVNSKYTNRLGNCSLLLITFMEYINMLCYAMSYYLMYSSKVINKRGQFLKCLVYLVYLDLINVKNCSSAVFLIQ